MICRRLTRNRWSLSLTVVAICMNKTIYQTYQMEPLPSQAVVAVHGWSGDENSLLPVARGVRCRSAIWQIPRGPFPLSDAPGYSWFQRRAHNEWAGEKSLEILSAMVAGLTDEGFAAEDIFLLGFSMGASAILDLAATWEQALGGVVAIAGFIRDPDWFRQRLTAAARRTPFLLLHGRQDEIVPAGASEAAEELLTEYGCPAVLDRYDAAHKIPVNKIHTIRKFLRNPSTIINSPALETI